MLVCNGRVSAALVNQNNKKETKKMTPNDIATDISGLTPANNGNIATMTRGTQSFVGQNWTIDDAYQLG